MTTWWRLLRGPLDVARAIRRLGANGLRTAVWAGWSCHRVRRQLARSGIGAVRLPAPPPASTHDRSVMLAVLRRAGATCLERSLIRQRWYAARQSRRTLVIGVTAPSAGFRAHAWLEGDAQAGHLELVEILRWPPSVDWLVDDRPSSALNQSMAEQRIEKVAHVPGGAIPVDRRGGQESRDQVGSGGPADQQRP